MFDKNLGSIGYAQKSTIDLRNETKNSPAGKSTECKVTEEVADKSIIDTDDRYYQGIPETKSLQRYRISVLPGNHIDSKLSRRSLSEPDVLKAQRRPAFEQKRHSLSEMASDTEVDSSSLDFKNNPFLKADNKGLKPSPSSSTESINRKISFKSVVSRVMKVIGLEKRYLGASLSNHVFISMKNVAGFENQGIPKSYLEKAQQVADKQKAIIAFRPVEMIYRTLIEEGYASKGLNIKGKSANWGPMAGFVPVDQRFSKISGNLEKEAKYNALNQQTLTDGYATSEQLCISNRRLNELLEMGMLCGHQQIEPFAEYIDACRFTSKPGDGESETFEAFQRTDGQWDIFSGSGPQRQPLEVMPVIADFDLFFVLSKYKSVDLGQQDRIKPFDKELGFVSGRKKEVIEALNKAFDRGEGRNIVHHGADTQNPVSEMDINFPTTIFIPAFMKKKMGIYSDSPLLVKNQDELVRFYRTMRDNGIFIEANPLWDLLKKVAKEPLERKIELFGGRRGSS